MGNYNLLSSREIRNVFRNTFVVSVILLLACGVILAANFVDPGKATFGALGGGKLGTRRKPAVLSPIN